MKRAALTLALMLAILSPAHAADPTADEMAHAMCASVIAAVAAKSAAPLNELLFIDARWWAAKVLDTRLIVAHMKVLQKALASDLTDKTWLSVVETAELCSQAKAEMTNGA